MFAGGLTSRKFYYVIIGSGEVVKYSLGESVNLGIMKKTHMKFGQELPESLEQRQQDESDETALGRRLRDLVPVHERGDGQSLLFLRVALLEELL